MFIILNLIMKIYSFINCSEWINQVIDRIVSSSEKAIHETCRFNIVLTGGSTPQMIYDQLKNIETEWSSWNFWISDERLPANDFDNFNSKMIFENFLNFIPIAKEQVNFISTNIDIETSIQLYSKKLGAVDIFDLTLLGIGEDGHTASLFPGNDWGISPYSSDVLLINNSPKYPTFRVSLSGNRLCRSKEVIFIARGDKKLDIVKKIENGEHLQLNSVRGINHTTLYYCIEN
jgi:6-phosphogluconolactonase